MKSLTIAGPVVLFVALFVVGASQARAQETPEFPQPQKEHEWLQQFVGEWETEAECTIAPGQPPIKCEGVEKAEMLGGFWMTARGQSEMMGMKISSVLTIGYDPEQEKYVGSWIDSMSSYLWHYAGSVDKSGKALTLLTEGPCHLRPGEVCKFKEVVEFKSADERVFTSSVQGEDGEWTTFVTVKYRRKK